MNEKTKIYDLEDRTAKFAHDTILLCKKTQKNIVTIPVLSQLIRAGTSQGANYREANGASSKKEFRCKILICKKEIKETKYWLEMLIVAANEMTEDCIALQQEAQELIFIFSKIAYNTKV